MSWLDKIVPSKAKSQLSSNSSKVPEGLWKKCVKCSSVLYRPELEKNLDVCPKCDHHFRIGARRRLDIFLDEEHREELAMDVVPVDRLNFKDIKKYKDRLSEAQKKTGEKDALIAMRGELLSSPFTAVQWAMLSAKNSRGRHKLPCKKIYL
jgi:acetyl-CoA carboxylase carboxyl transferase subunit beta